MRNMTCSPVLAIVAVIMLTLMAGPRSAAAQPAALSRATTLDAIDFGVNDNPEPYVLRHAKARGDGTNDVVVGAVFTPFIRVALAARLASEQGQRLDPDDLPEWLTAPVIHVAVRWYMGGRCEFEPRVPLPAVNAVRQGTHTQPWFPPISEGQPLEVFSGASFASRVGTRLSFADTALVVSYPLEMLREGIDVLVSKHGERNGRLGACVVRGRIPVAESRSWR